MAGVKKLRPFMKIRSLDLKKENRQIAHTRFDYLLLLQSISHPPINRGTNFEIQTKKKMRHNVHTTKTNIIHEIFTTIT